MACEERSSRFQVGCENSGGSILGKRWRTEGFMPEPACSLDAGFVMWRRLGGTAVRHMKAVDVGFRFRVWVSLRRLVSWLGSSHSVRPVYISLDVG